jgi:serine/threonine protein kinase
VLLLQGSLRAALDGGLLDSRLTRRPDYHTVLSLALVSPAIEQSVSSMHVLKVSYNPGSRVLPPGYAVDALQGCDAATRSDLLLTVGCHTHCVFLPQGVAHAMNHLHGEGIVHGDLKAGNVLLKAELLPVPNTAASTAAAASGGYPSSSANAAMAGTSGASGRPGFSGAAGPSSGFSGHSGGSGSRVVGGGVVHQEQMVAKVADFGLACRLRDQDTHVSGVHRVSEGPLWGDGHSCGATGSGTAATLHGCLKVLPKKTAYPLEQASFKPQSDMYFLIQSPLCIIQSVALVKRGNHPWATAAATFAAAAGCRAR